VFETREVRGPQQMIDVASARNASRGTTSTSSPITRSTRMPKAPPAALSAEIFRYGVASLPSGNSGVCL
jgi:hypothetical protein